MRFMTDSQALHAAVKSAFPPEKGGEKVLWRLEHNDYELKLLILSESVPSLEHLREQAGWESSTWETKDYTPVLSGIAEGKRYSFRLVANPTFTLTENGKKRRVAHITHWQQMCWLAERADKLGVRFLDAAGMPVDASAVKRNPDGRSFPTVLDATNEPAILVSHRDVQKFPRRDPFSDAGKRMRVTIAKAQFDGAFEVVDAQLLRAAIVNGVGRAKAYGCGLLTLAPIG